MSDNILYEDIIGDMLIDTQSVALCLAMSSTMLTENALKELCYKKGYRCVVTEFGGNETDFGRKVIGHIIGACLNKNVIAKEVNEIHAVIHAAEEAARGFLASTSIMVNVALKIAVVRHKNWLSVAFVGYSALYYITNHRRACVGTMHI
jgi:hut operon positive regulator